MEPNTILLEINPVGDIYEDLAKLNNLMYYKINLKVENVSIELLEPKILHLVDVWHKKKQTYNL